MQPSLAWSLHRIFATVLWLGIRECSSTGSGSLLANSFGVSSPLPLGSEGKLQYPAEDKSAKSFLSFLSFRPKWRNLWTSGSENYRCLDFARHDKGRLKVACLFKTKPTPVAP